MIRLLLAAVIVAGAGVVAALLSRRRPPAVATSFPASVDLRGTGLEAGGVVLFVDRGCHACEGVLEQIRASGRPFVVIEAEEARRVHGVRSYPTTVEVGPDGIVARGWIGPLPPRALDSVRGSQG